MMRVLGLVFAFNLLLFTAACTFCCFPCCCFWYSVNCLLLLLNCFVVLLLFVVDFFLFVVAFTVGFVENCLLLVIVALNCLLLKLLLLLLLESSIILCNWLKLLKSSNPCIDGDDIGDSYFCFPIETTRWRSPQIGIDQSESDYQFENHPNGESSNSFKYSTLSASYSSKLSSEYILNWIYYIWVMQYDSYSSTPMTHSLWVQVWNIGWTIRNPCWVKEFLLYLLSLWIRSTRSQKSTFLICFEFGRWRHLKGFSMGCSRPIRIRVRNIYSKTCLKISDTFLKNTFQSKLFPSLKIS